MNLIELIDKKIFILINNNWTNSFFDLIMPVITDFHKNSIFQLIVLPILFLLLIIKEKKNSILIIFGIVAVVGIGDNISHRVIKPFVKRSRPAAEIVTTRRLTIPHAGYSFPSNHAVNMFALTAFTAFLLPGLKYFALLFAFLIGYSRIYVGVHYPLDVLGGILFGLLIGAILGFAFSKIKNLS